MVSARSLLLAAPVVAGSAPVVQTEYGAVKGFTRPMPRTQKNVDVFWGIPFAAPPVGENRFRAPQPFDEPWEGERAATKPPHICPQFDVVGKVGLGKEDCLYLNVYRPHGATNESSIPVFVWIYGGAYILGDGWEFSFYDGSNVVSRHEHIVASMNYRLSGLGFMALPELADEDGAFGNYGLLDQRASLQWLQRNVRNFGGDPGQVTLAGESAGGISVMFHLASPGSKGLFHRAIMESGSSHANWIFQEKDQAVRFYEEYAGILGCKDAATRVQCLRALPATKLQYSFAEMAFDFYAEKVHHKHPLLPLPGDVPRYASPLWPVLQFGPVIDGSRTGLPDVPLTLVKKGDFNRVPLIVGANQDGGIYFGPVAPVALGLPDFNLKDVVERVLVDKTDRQRVIELYNTSDFPNDNMRVDRILRDAIFQCADRELASAWSAQGLPTYLYTFSFNFTGVIEKKFRDAHAFELPFVFRNYVKFMESSSIHGGDSFERMEDVMSCTWASFIRCGAPKCSQEETPPHCDYVLESLPEWPVFNGSEGYDARKYYSLRTDPIVKEILPKASFRIEDEFPGDDKCDFWATANYDFPSHRRADPEVHEVLV